MSDVTLGKVKKVMPQSILRFIRRSAEFLKRNDVSHLQEGLRGIYVLYNGYIERGKERYDVRYIGMSAGKRFGIIRTLTLPCKVKAKRRRVNSFFGFSGLGQCDRPGNC
jgi:hypothetical protein